MPTATRLRMAVGAVPLSIGWKSAFWASDASWSNPGDGNAVSSWRNAGTDGTAAVQATGSLQPIYRSSSSPLNSKPAVDFDGADDIITADTVDVAAPWSLVVIAHHDDLGVDSLVGWAASATGALTYQGTLYRFGDSTNFVSLTTSAQTVCIIGYANGASSTLEVNGSAGSVTGTGVSTTATAFRIGNRASSAPFDGQISFVGFINRVLTSDEKAALLAWSRSYYGTP